MEEKCYLQEQESSEKEARKHHTQQASRGISVWCRERFWKPKAIGRLQFGASFLSVQGAMLSTGRRRPKAPSGSHQHAVSVWRHQPFLAVRRLQFGAIFFSVQKPTLGTGTGRRHLPAFTAFTCAYFFGVATPAFFGGRTATIWSRFLVRLESNVRHRPPQAEGTLRPSCCFGVATPAFLGPVSGRARKQRWAQAVAGGRHLPAFTETGVLLGCGGTGRTATIWSQISCRFRKQR